MKDHSLEVHGCHTYDATGAISPSICLSATFRHPRFGESTGYDYGRVANPTRESLEKTVALLERGGRSWALSSGMAAVQLVFSLLSAGYGVTFEYVDVRDLALVGKRMRPETKLVFIETPSNPMMQISDIAALSALAHENGALLAVDNTFLSPHFQKPLTLGADIVLHSGTKYLCGHNDVIAGFLVLKDATSAQAKRIELLAKSAGPNLSALDSWLMLRSIKTLGVRVERQAENALAIAQWLGTLPEVTEVLYPGLADHPGYALQQKQASGAGGMISFKVRSAEIAKAALGRLHLIAFAESLGGVETLLTYPIAQTHAEMPAALLKRTGLDDKLLRLSVGIEDVEDLKTDLQQALQG